jgi:hypothetical protein
MRFLEETNLTNQFPVDFLEILKHRNFHFQILHFVSNKM